MPANGLRNAQLTENRQLSDISGIAGLLKLKSLDISFTQVADLSPIAGLNNLQELLCVYSQIYDLSPLAGLINLYTLKCYSTQVGDLIPLTGLANLQVLNCSSTRVKDISPLIPLIRKGRRITLNGTSDQGIFDFLDCPLVNPPIEVVQQGNEAILGYFGVIRKTSAEPISTVDESLQRRRYPGLRPFERSESDIFFARDREAEEFANFLIREH